MTSSPVRYARLFPSQRTEHVSPGHLVAMATATHGIETVVWRWYDALVLGDEKGRGQALGASTRRGAGSASARVRTRAARYSRLVPTCPPDSLELIGGSTVP